MSDFPKAVNDILNNANFPDAGNSAFLNSCKVSLADRATQFLGNGNWAPRDDYTISDA